MVKERAEHTDPFFLHSSKTASPVVMENLKPSDLLNMNIKKESTK